MEGENKKDKESILPEFISSQRYLSLGIVAGSLLFVSYLLANVKKASYGYKSNQVIDDKEDNIIHRSKMIKSRDALVDHFETIYGVKIYNLHDNFEYIAKNNPSNIYLSEEIRNIQVFKTYHEIAEQRNHVGSGLIQLGLKTQQKVGVFTNNGINTTILRHATESYSFIYCYIPNQEQNAEKVLTESNFEVIVVDKEEKLLKIQQLLSKMIEKPKHIIYDFDLDEEKLRQFKSDLSLSGVSLSDWHDLVENGKLHPSEHVVPLPEYISNIIYENPINKNFQEIKITHKNIISYAGSFKKNAMFFSNEKYFDYLGDNHLMNLLLKTYIVSCASQTYIFDGESSKLENEIKEIKPTVLITPPNFLETLSKNIDTITQRYSGLSNSLYHGTFYIKRLFIERNFKNSQPFFDVLAFSNIKNELGYYKHIFSESLISAELSDKIRICFTCDLYHGLNGFTLSLPDDHSNGNFGVPLPNVEVMIRNEDEEEVGEVCFRGAGVLSGYFDGQQDKDWYYSGIHGKFDKDGTFVQKKEQK